MSGDLRADAATLARQQSTDAMAWAEAFVEAEMRNPGLFATDAGAMVAWFAAAIGSGRSAGQRSAEDEYERGKRDGAAALILADMPTAHAPADTGKAGA